jgi:cell division protein YceG involved in septum cleavage
MMAKTKIDKKDYGREFLILQSEFRETTKSIKLILVLVGVVLLLVAVLLAVNFSYSMNNRKMIEETNELTNVILSSFTTTNERVSSLESNQEVVFSALGEIIQAIQYIAVQANITAPVD